MFDEKPKEAEQLKPPQCEEVLVKILKRWGMKNKSETVPRDYLAAARWWMNHQEERGYADRPEAITDQNGNIRGWNTPYHDRLSYNLRKFLRLSEYEKAFVIHHIEDGIPYRGDDIDFFKSVVSETEIMRQDPEAYKTKASGALSELRKQGVI